MNSGQLEIIKSREMATIGLFDLPQELRDLIVYDLIHKPTNTITMLSGLANRKDISACLPNICNVNRQLRQETLPTFYGANIFSAQLDNHNDLEVAKRWLTTIGDRNVQHLQRISMYGIIRLPFGHMSRRSKLKVVYELKRGTMDVGDSDGVRAGPDQDAHMMSIVEELKSAYHALINARAGKPMDASSLQRLMDHFNSLCPGY